MTLEIGSTYRTGLGEGIVDSFGKPYLDNELYAYVVGSGWATWARVPEGNVIKVNIYVLRDPRNNEIFYVGRTRETLEFRLYHHMNDSKRVTQFNGKKYQFINQLLKQNLKPMIELVEETIEDYAYEREVYWFEKLIAEGTSLLNSGRPGKYRRYTKPA